MCQRRQVVSDIRYPYVSTSKALRPNPQSRRAVVCLCNVCMRASMHACIHMYVCIYACMHVRECVRACGKQVAAYSIWAHVLGAFATMLDFDLLATEPLILLPPGKTVDWNAGGLDWNDRGLDWNAGGMWRLLTTKPPVALDDFIRPQQRRCLPQVLLRCSYASLDSPYVHTRTHTHTHTQNTHTCMCTHTHTYIRIFDARRCSWVVRILPGTARNFCRFARSAVPICRRFRVGFDLWDLTARGTVRGR